MQMDGADSSAAGKAAGSSREGDPRLTEARRLLEELKQVEGTDALAPAKRLADLLEELLEGREGKQS